MPGHVRRSRNQTVSSEHLGFFLFLVFFITPSVILGSVLQIRLAIRQLFDAQNIDYRIVSYHVQ